MKNPDINKIMVFNKGMSINLIWVILKGGQTDPVSISGLSP